MILNEYIVYLCTCSFIYYRQYVNKALPNQMPQNPETTPPHPITKQLKDWKFAGLKFPFSVLFSFKFNL